MLLTPVAAGLKEVANAGKKPGGGVDKTVTRKESSGNFGKMVAVRRTI